MKNKRSSDIVNTLVKKQKLVDKMWPDEMTPQEAKKIEMLEEKWRKQSDENNRRQAQETIDFFKVPLALPVKPKNEMMLLPPQDNTPMTVKEARALDKLEDKLKKDTEAWRTIQTEELRDIEKKQKPIVEAIKEQTQTLDKKPAKQTKSVQITRKFRPRASSTPGKSKLSVDAQAREVALPEEEPDVFETPTILPPTPAQTIEMEEQQNRSIREFTENENLGYIAKKYLPSGNDRVFGIYYDFSNNKLAIGSQTITIENDDIILDNTMDRYRGTEGLWRLLTKTEIHGPHPSLAVGVTPKMRLISSGAFTSKDLENYKDILTKTNAIYHNYDPNSRPKSNGGWKWVNLISEIYKEIKQQTSGSGLLVDTDNPVEYKYIDDYEKLRERIEFIQAEEAAGNNNFNNEKMAILKFLNDRMEKLIAEPQGIKYINQCFSVMPANVEGGKLADDSGTKIQTIKLGLASDRKKYMHLLDRR